MFLSPYYVRDSRIVIVGDGGEKICDGAVAPRHGEILYGIRGNMYFPSQYVIVYKIMVCLDFETPAVRRAGSKFCLTLFARQVPASMRGGALRRVRA
jgi:hypothetical protein